MKKKTIVAFMVAIVLLFAACDKDKENNNDSMKTYDPLAQATQKSNSGKDADAWWKQYTTEVDPNKATTAKSSSKTTTKINSKTTQQSTTTTQKAAPQKNNDAHQDLGYEKINQNTMTFSNSNGGTTTLTKDPENKYIKKAISRLSTDLGESATAAQMMCYSDTDGNNFVYIYTGSSGKSASTLMYVICLNSDTTPVAFVKASDGTELVFFPYASSGGSSYTKYRDAYKTVMDSMDSSAFSYIRGQYTTLHDDSNVKTFLSW